jgi:nitrous oxidase accessory protein
VAATTPKTFLLVAALIAPLLAATPAGAAAIRVGVRENHASIAAGLAAAQPGDTVLVAGGLYNEHGLVVTVPLVLLGKDFPVLDAQNAGDILTVTAPGAVVSGFVFQNVGASYIEDRAAVRVQTANGVRIEDCRFENTIFGVYVEHSDSVRVIRNHLTGSGGSEVSAGNGIHLWYCKHARVEDNEIHRHRDGIYFEFVEDSMIRGNLSSHNVRYGLHFMFSHRDEYVNNRFEDNGAGVAVMYTTHVVMRGNQFVHNWGTSSYGLLLKEIGDSEITGNRFIENTVALHAEGSNRLHVEGNEFVANGYAIRLMANSMGGTFARNNFTGNAFDVATNSRQSFNTFDSNYWSEYRGHDLDRDGTGDVPHHPVRLFSLLVEKSPPGLVLLGSLFVNLIDTAERVMPVFTPETLVDAHPRMSALSLEGALAAAPAPGRVR